MNTILSRSTRLSRGTTLLAMLALAVLGLTAFAASASAQFTLNSGTLSLTDGTVDGDPPSGSWVELPTDKPASPPYFANPSSSWTGTTEGEPPVTTGQYTLIKNKDSLLGSTALELGSTQPTGGIFGNSTDQFGGAPFYAVTTSAPTLHFYGSATDTGTRKLKWGNLSGLEIVYKEGTYDVSTTSKPGGKHVVPLTGHIIGDATDPENPALITLDWTSDLVEPGFSDYQAHFHWEGHYIP